MSKFQKYNLFIYLFITLLSYSTQAQENSNAINIIRPNFEHLTISKQFSYSTASEIKGIYEIIKNDSLLKFTSEKFINSGFFKPYNWIKCNFLNNSNQTEFIFEFNQTYIDSLKVFIVKEGKILKEFPKKGMYFKHNNNPSFLSNKYAYTYLVTLPKNQISSIYIQAIVNDGSLRVTNSLWKVSKYEERKKDIKIRTSYLLAFSGFASFIIIFSIILFLFSKKKVYLYYAGFVFVVSVNLIAVRHLISPIYIEKYFFLGNNFSEMFGLLQIIFLIQYANHFLSLKKEYPTFYVLLRYLAFFTFLLYLFSLFMREFNWFSTFGYYFSKIEMIFLILFLYSIAISLIIRKNIMAYYFVIAYLPLVFFVIHYVLTAFQLTTSYNPLQWELVIFFEISVLTIAMAHNYYLLVKENLIYQNKIYNQRLKISRDLHDNIGSQLTFIISSIDNLKFITKNSDEVVKNKLSEINQFTNNTISQLRDTIWAMNKNEISFEDFQGRVLAFIEKAKIATHGIKFNLNSTVSSPIFFSSIKGINIFRVIQEAINNAIKYANASEIIININEINNKLIIEIKDNGTGFNLDTVELGNGLKNMQHRIEEINGEITIYSVINKGTSIIISCLKNKTNAV
ncbi:7TM diverse intracellular signaling domain-containing protein [Lutibacter sp.]|uniref:7TM diverse intracellular signaling domain-containing protein n=1 Tax=Lutibacter sp. TaxID=1925666 RepID=UPI0025BF854B|nr:7TM diverse intracellular signaling domain-containing protein [Lutibacter sp.]MCF6168298.1 histidine kinase [Lutibacter sp.]